MKIGLNIGAGIGQSNNLFSDFDIIHCFEPQFFSFNQLKLLDQSNLILHNYGISDINGYKTFTNYFHIGYSSLLDLDKDSEFYKFLTTEQDIEFDKDTWKTEVEVKRLDNFIIENNIKHISLIKIDTQGHDLNVVKSLGNYINIVDTIMLECQLKNLYKNSFTKDEVITYMEKNNFTLTNVKNNYNLPTDKIPSDGINWEENLTFKNEKI